VKVTLGKKAAKQLARLNESWKRRILTALHNLEKEPPEGDIKPLEGQSEHWRIRVGGLRVLYKTEAGVVSVTRIEPRGQAYKKGNRE